MATMITDECINCDACVPECPTEAIYPPGEKYEFFGEKHPALSSDFYYIVPEKCVECVGFHNTEQCATVCPVDCCIPDPEREETEDQLFEKLKKLLPEQTFELTAETSKYRN